MTDAHFWDKIARKYSRRPISNISAYEKTLERVRSHLGANDKVVELGCGTGSTGLLLANCVSSYLGTDVSPEMIEIANEKLAETPIDRLNFAVTDAHALDLDDESFDAVLGFNLYHLVPDLDGALKRARDLLKPGGLFITKTPCIGGKWYFRPVIGVMQLIGKAPYLRYLKVDEYDALIRATGFEIIETGLYPPSAPSRFVVARKI
ncbi:MAG: class I SAM-dependent methyltransferase [Boseongicola sp.]